MTTYGYLELPYLQDPYMAAVTQRGASSQVTLVINKTNEAKSQVSAKIYGDHDAPSQVQFKVYDQKSANSQVSLKIYKTNDAKSQVNAKIYENHQAPSQVQLKAYKTKATHGQITFKIYDDKTANSQVSLKSYQTHAASSQVKLQIIGLIERMGNQLKVGKNLHEHCEDYGYLNQPYLTMQYLSDYICVHQRSQVTAKIGTDHTVGSQITAKIIKNHDIASQVLGKIFTKKDTNAQVTFIKAHKLSSQVRAVLYNTTNLRIMSDFPSRGAKIGSGNNAWGNPKASGQNWVASSTEIGDFQVENLNTDIVEQVWRSNGDISGIQLKCDTELSQGVFVDTLAILNHNLTVSGEVQLQGSTASDFSSVGFAKTLTVVKNHPNIYYIADTLPTESYRYWRLLINDLSNADGYIQIGTIIFGSSIIFQGECIVDEVSKSTRHFSDKVDTEGFTNVSNDRALKYAVGLEFRRLRYNRGNYNNIRGVFDTARTSLKCLWIPTPQYPQRFAVFGKLPSIPPEVHNVKGENMDFVDFSIEVDESL